MQNSVQHENNILDSIDIPGGLIKIIITAQGKDLLPEFTGNIIRGVFLNFIRNNNFALSEKLHRSNEIRPYSIKQIRILNRKTKRTERKEIIIQKGDEIEFSIGMLDNNLLKEITQLFIQNASPEIDLLGKKYLIKSMQYEKIKCNFKKNRNKVKIYFNSPTYFSVKKKPESMLFPNPRYLFMNLLKIWNSLNKDIMIPEEDLYNWIDENIIINDYATYTRRLHLFKNTPIIGFMGWVVYRFKTKNAMIFWINVLLEYAKISNVGGNRTGGMGEIDFRWLEKQEVRISEEKMI